MMARLAIAAGAMRLEVQPALGGAVTGGWHGRQALLRTAPAVLTHPFDAACFVMVPYANRIADGRVSHGGMEAQLAPKLAGEPHPLHGIGLIRPWSVTAHTPTCLDLSLNHTADAVWPWSFTCRQRLSVDPDGATMSVELRNDDDRPMPAGLGFHPYFANAAEARLTANVAAMFLADDRQLPTGRCGPATRHWATGAAVRGGDLVDHCHPGWDGTAQIDWPDGTGVRLLSGAPLRYLHIYAAPERDFFCVEPVSHVPNAINAIDPAAH